MILPMRPTTTGSPRSATFVPVVLAGGAGTRLWPLSRELHPKQFQRLVGERTMFQDTLARLDGLPCAAPVVVCNHEHRFLVAEQCRTLGVRTAAVLLEPEPRNTAPALAVAALHLAQAGDATLLALPADHHIGDVAAFRASVERALPLAEAGRIVAFGVVPSRPETGYGYIRAGGPRADGSAEIAAFVEKPSLDAARGYLEAGGYYWNSGIFMAKASVYLEELRRFRPDIHAACERAVADVREEGDFRHLGHTFLSSPSDSIDYAVMEKTTRGVVVPTEMAWSDVGSWRALAEVLGEGADADGNTMHGDVLAVGTRNSHLAAHNRLLAAVGLDGAVVVETADAVLVADKAHVQEVKMAAAQLQALGRSEQREHATVQRPWGSAETFKSGDGFLVKRISVAPGESLSLQMHHHRSEHWVVVRGEAQVQRGEETFVLQADESIHIPAGTRHRLANQGPGPLDIVEVQLGSLLSEDDIVRFSDRYGRG